MSKITLQNELLKVTFSTMLYIPFMYFYPANSFKFAMLYAIVTFTFGSIIAWLILRKGSESFSDLNGLNNWNGICLQLVHWIWSAIGIYFGITWFLWETVNDIIIFVVVYFMYRLLVEVFLIRYIASEIANNKIFFAFLSGLLITICFM